MYNTNVYVIYIYIYIHVACTKYEGLPEVCKVSRKRGRPKKRKHLSEADKAPECGRGP